MVSAIHQHESATGIHISPPSGNCLPIPPLQVSQSTDFGFPVSYKFPQAIYFAYDNVYVSMLLLSFFNSNPSSTLFDLGFAFTSQRKLIWQNQ